MFEEIAGLPAHPLFVHAAVVSVPVLALLAALHALVPVARERAEAPLIALAVAAPLSVAIARESGAALQRRLIDTGATPPGMLSEIQAHADRSGTLLLLTLALSVASAASVTLYRARDTESKSGSSPSGADSGSVGPATPQTLAARLASHRLSTLATRTAVCIVGIGALWAVITTAHAGTSMVWN